MSFTINAKIITRNGTAAEWTAENPTLLLGEVGVESDTNKVKIGDGSTAWNSLPYFTANGYAQVITVAKSGGDYTTVQAAIDSITDSSASKPYLIAVYPGIYSEAVVVDAAYVTLIGVGGPEACVVRNDDNGDVGDWDAAVTVTESNVALIALGIRNLFTVSAPPGIEATMALVIGGKTSTAAQSGVRVRGCRITCTGRDAVFIRGALSDCIVEDCEITGYSHSPSVDAGPTGDTKTCACEFRRCKISTTYAPCWVGPAATDTVTVEFRDCTVSSNTSEPCFYLDRAGASTITAQNVQCSASMYLYQTTATHAGATTINHAGVVVDGDRTGALVGSVTLTALTQRATKVESLESVGIIEAGGYVSAQGAFVSGDLTSGGFQVPIEGYAGGYLKCSGDGFRVRGVEDGTDEPLIASALESTVTTGTAPLTVASTTKVTNLNADLLDGLHDTAFVKHSIATAKGDILSATGSGAIARVAAGADGKSLVYDSAQAAGVAAAERARVLYVTTSDSASIANTTAETDFNQSYDFAANTLAVGQVYRLTFAGSCAYNATGQTLRIKVYLGSTAIFDSGARPTQNATAQLYVMLNIVVRSIGATGVVLTAMPKYDVFWYTNSSVPYGFVVDTTGTLTLKASAQWSVGSASATCKLMSMFVERLA